MCERNSKEYEKERKKETKEVTRSLYTKKRRMQGHPKKERRQAVRIGVEEVGKEIIVWRTRSLDVTTSNGKVC